MMLRAVIEPSQKLGSPRAVRRLCFFFLKQYNPQMAFLRETKLD
ncbi:hypothetical protein Goklo_024907, partial [Gossypium klotzschianum]|nr:hypothetical protein [Gossypium klotzschianum]